jgi:endonuclease/exonuclease/phosphatase (EEP) superfamily protein YafD
MDRKALTVVLLFSGGLHLLAVKSFHLYASSVVTPKVSATIQVAEPQSESGPVVRLAFDGTVSGASGTSPMEIVGGPVSFEPGLDGLALSLGGDGPSAFLTLNSRELPFDGSRDFSVQFWLRTVADDDKRYVLLSQKEFADNSLASQKQPGWVFYFSGGTWAWNLGSGERRITYERENGKHMPLNDGRWHQLTMTYSSAQSVIRLFYDGDNKVSFHVSDSDGFDFGNPNPMVVGWNGAGAGPQPAVLPLIETGAAELQALVDVFNGFGLDELESDEFVHLIVDPRRLFDHKVAERIQRLGADSLGFREAMDKVDWEPIAQLETGLMSNPYTVHQVLNFMEVAPLMKIYGLEDGKVTVNRSAAAGFAEAERLHASEFDMDNLAIWDRALSPQEVLEAYSEHFVPAVAKLEQGLTSITAGCWNIWHGGKHFSVDEHGWDSRVAIAEILRREDADVVMMQETYSSGDFIAAELGFYFATTVDWDYLNQGSNISVLSRYPIKEISVQDESPFMNVAAKVTISETQDMYVMSNWYGMRQFPAVFEFHQTRFLESDSIPILFAGDFNAVPHTDNGDSPASLAMLNAGFTDAFRSLHPDAAVYPGHTHRSGSRIDQLYYKGAGLSNTSTRIVSTWPAGFPSDHYLIVSTFDLDYATAETGR